MLPITVDIARLRVVLIGNGDAARRRLALLDCAGARRLEVYAPAPSPDLAHVAGARLRRRLPRAAEIARAQLMFLAGVEDPAASRLVQVAREAGVLLNVEDDIARSDFHSPAIMRRGDLTVAVSTGGKSPGLAAAIRRQLDERFGPEWARRLERIAALRARWREDGGDAAAVARRTRSWLARQREVWGSGPQETRAVDADA